MQDVWFVDFLEVKSRECVADMLFTKSQVRLAPEFDCSGGAKDDPLKVMLRSCCSIDI